jgi:hypothetical protein
MFAGFRVDASIGQHQSLYGATCNQVRSNNLSHICRANVPIPDRFGIDHNGRPMFTLIQAPGLINADRPLQASSVNSLLQQRMQLRFAIGIATRTSAAWFALVGTHKHVVLILRQETAPEKILLLLSS